MPTPHWDEHSLHGDSTTVGAASPGTYTGDGAGDDDDVAVLATGDGTLSCAGDSDGAGVVVTVVLVVVTLVLVGGLLDGATTSDDDTVDGVADGGEVAD